MYKTQSPENNLDPFDEHTYSSQYIAIKSIVSQQLWEMK